MNTVTYRDAFLRAAPTLTDRGEPTVGGDSGRSAHRERSSPALRSPPVGDGHRPQERTPEQEVGGVEGGQRPAGQCPGGEAGGCGVALDGDPEPGGDPPGGPRRRHRDRAQRGRDDGGEGGTRRPRRPGTHRGKVSPHGAIRPTEAKATRRETTDRGITYTSPGNHSGTCPWPWSPKEGLRVPRVRHRAEGSTAKGTA